MKSNFRSHLAAVSCKQITVIASITDYLKRNKYLKTNCTSALGLANVT